MSIARRRGFTLLEMVIAVALVALMSAISISVLSRARREQHLRGVARSLVGALNDARAMSAGGKVVRTGHDGGDCAVGCSGVSNSAGESPNQPGRSVSEMKRVSRSGIIVSSTRFSVFADDDRDPANGELILSAYSLERELGPGFEIVEPAAETRIVFQANGVREAGSPARIRVRDTIGGGEYAIAVGIAGLARIERAAR